MATINSLIDDARYDLRDYQTGLEFDDEELILFLNRMIRALDSSLAALSSDLVLASASLTLALAGSSIDLSATPNSGNWDSIRKLWYGTRFIREVSFEQLQYERLFSPGAALPYYWTVYNKSVLFERAADAAYTLTCWYAKTTGTVTGTSDTPYYGIFDDWLREMLVMHTRAKRDGNPGQGNMMYSELAKKKALEIHVRRSTIEKPYKLDF